MYGTLVSPENACGAGRVGCAAHARCTRRPAQAAAAASPASHDTVGGKVSMLLLVTDIPPARHDGRPQTTVKVLSAAAWLNLTGEWYPMRKRIMDEASSLAWPSSREA